MILRSNGGEMVIDHKAVVAVYIKDLWFEKNSITNIFALKNRIQQCRLTYDSLNQIFIVHHKENNKTNIHFIINEIGIHYYDSAEDFTFVTTVTDNKKHYRNRQIKAAERAEEIYGTVTYTYVADYIWEIQSN